MRNGQRKAAGFCVEGLFCGLGVLGLLLGDLGGLDGGLLFHGLGHGVSGFCLGFGLFVALVYAVGGTARSNDCGGDACYGCGFESHGCLLVEGVGVYALGNGLSDAFRVVLDQVRIPGM